MSRIRKIFITKVNLGRAGKARELPLVKGKEDDPEDLRISKAEAVVGFINELYKTASKSESKKNPVSSKLTE